MFCDLITEILDVCGILQVLFILFIYFSEEMATHFPVFKPHIGIVTHVIEHCDLYLSDDRSITLT